MVEQGIYFALGCIITALFALMFAPVFWRRALRLTRKHLQLQVPLSMQEILAERDQLRAEFAVERLRIEQALEKVQASKAADMAEIGRRSVETTALRDDLSVLRETDQAQRREVDALARQVAEAGAEAAALKTALHDAYLAVERWQQRAHASAAEEDRLGGEVEAHRTTIAGLETRAMGLEMRLTDAARLGSSRLGAAEVGWRNRLEVAIKQANRHETSAISLRRECDDAKARLHALEAELETASRMVEVAREREKAAHLQNGLRAEKARGADRAQAERFDALQADNASLLAALEAARRQGTIEAPSRALEGSDDDLRSSIHALGLAVAMMTRRAGGQATDGGAAPRPIRTDAPSPVDAD